MPLRQRACGHLHPLLGGRTGLPRSSRFGRSFGLECGRGGTGRRATLRSLWANARGSSSLLDRTKHSNSKLNNAALAPRWLGTPGDLGFVPAVVGKSGSKTHVPTPSQGPFPRMFLFGPCSPRLVRGRQQDRQEPREKPKPRRGPPKVACQAPRIAVVLAPLSPFRMRSAPSPSMRLHSRAGHCCRACCAH